MGQLDGACLCGAVRYRCGGEPIMTAVCHCKDCQRQTGTAFSIVVAVDLEQLELTGEVASHTTVGEETGQDVVRQFCPACGSPIMSLPAVAAGLGFIKAGTLDDPSWLAPEMEIWCRSAQPWVASQDPEARGQFPTGIPT